MSANPSPGSIEYERAYMAPRAAQAAERIAERDARRDARRDPATEEAFAKVASIDEQFAAAERRLREKIRPQPLIDRPTLPDWPVDVLPGWVADHVTDTAARLQVPPDLCAQLAVGGLAAVAAGHGHISAGSWREPLNLYLWCAMHSGAGKSPAEKAMIGPLRAWERDRQVALADDHTFAVGVWKAAKRKAADDEKGWAVGSVSDEAYRASLTAASEPRPVPYRLTVDDTTPERLVQLLGDHQRMALISTEAGLLDSVAGAFSAGRQPNIDVYLKAWAGETIIRDRKGGDSGPEAVVVEDALLSVVLTIQPSVVEKYQMTAPELRGRGFFARFMPSIPASLVGTRTYGDMAPPGPSAQRYGAELRAMADRLIATTEAVPMHLDATAAALFFAWCDDIEAQLAPGERLDVLHDAASKIRSSALRVAGLLELADGRHGPAVGVGVMERALHVADYWVAHALAMEVAAGPDEETARVARDALAIIDWARKHPEVMEEGFTPRSVWAGKRPTWRAVEDLVPGLEHLRDRGWLWFVKGTLDDVGGRGSSVIVRLHPDAFTLSSHDLTSGRRTRTTPNVVHDNAESRVLSRVLPGEVDETPEVGAIGENVSSRVFCLCLLEG